MQRGPSVQLKLGLRAHPGNRAWTQHARLWLGTRTLGMAGRVSERISSLIPSGTLVLRTCG